MSLTIDCGEGRHFPICTGTGTERYLMPQQNDPNDEFVCACGCHLTDPPGSGISGPGPSEVDKLNYMPNQYDPEEDPVPFDDQFETPAQSDPDDR
jgi:hypothetical protein